jgi:hypothetical protein
MCRYELNGHRDGTIVVLWFLSDDDLAFITRHSLAALGLNYLR